MWIYYKLYYKDKDGNERIDHEICENYNLPIPKINDKVHIITKDISYWGIVKDIIFEKSLTTESSDSETIILDVKCYVVDKKRNAKKRNDSTRTNRRIK